MKLKESIIKKLKTHRKLRRQLVGVLNRSETHVLALINGSKVRSMVANADNSDLTKAEAVQTIAVYFKISAEDVLTKE